MSALYLLCPRVIALKCMTKRAYFAEVRFARIKREKKWGGGEKKNEEKTK